MNSILNKNHFFVKEHVRILKAANQFDVYEIESQTPVIHCKEVEMSLITKIFRYTKYKAYTPFSFDVTTIDSQDKIMNLKRGYTFFRSVIEVTDEQGNLVGYIRRLFKFLKPSFEIIDSEFRQLATIDGDFFAWDFKIRNSNQEEIAVVTKKWGGLGKELFTNADNYAFIINENVKQDDKIRMILLATVVSIDMVLKER
jgi:uncharacterized protein YxjI